jgi:2-iminoacetate synthase ThiH
MVVKQNGPTGADKSAMTLITVVSPIAQDEAFALAEKSDTRSLMLGAAALRDEGHGNVVTYSRKVFIP